MKLKVLSDSQLQVSTHSFNFSNEVVTSGQESQVISTEAGFRIAV